ELHRVELRLFARITVEQCQMPGRFGDELLENARLPEATGARIGNIERELRGHQNRIQSRRGELLRHTLALIHVALQAHVVAVEEYDDQGRPRRVEALRQVK